MENYILEEDITVLCVTAVSFPEAVMAAHKLLHDKLTPNSNRRFFGISRPDQNSQIIYKAAAEELVTGEEKATGLEKFVIKKGRYVSIFISNFMDDLQQIARAFQELLKYPGIDPDGYCLEMYLSEVDVWCMVGLKE